MRKARQLLQSLQVFRKPRPPKDMICQKSAQGIQKTAVRLLQYAKGLGIPLFLLSSKIPLNNPWKPRLFSPTDHVSKIKVFLGVGYQEVDCEVLRHQCQKISESSSDSGNFG